MNKVTTKERYEDIIETLRAMQGIEVSDSKYGLEFTTKESQIIKDILVAEFKKLLNNL